MQLRSFSGRAGLCILGHLECSTCTDRECQHFVAVFETEGSCLQCCRDLSLLLAATEGLLIWDSQQCPHSYIPRSTSWKDQWTLSISVSLLLWHTHTYSLPLFWVENLKIKSLWSWTIDISSSPITGAERRWARRPGEAGVSWSLREVGEACSDLGLDSLLLLCCGHRQYGVWLGLKYLGMWTHS